MRGAILFFLLCGFLSVQLVSTTLYSCDPTVSCGCSALSTVVTARIVGGEPASNDAWGWMLSLQRYGSHICGASLLTPEHAVTAAHCVQNVLNNPSALSILAGTNYLNDTSNTTVQSRTVTRIIIHPNFNSNSLTNDIAILQFSPLTISASSKIAFICLPTANQDPFQTNSDLVAIGWGVTSYGSTTQSNTLQQVTVQVFSSTSTDCLQTQLSNPNVQFCAGISGGGKGKSLFMFNF
jgi:secreted trypsin-like serine protease